MLGRLRMSVDQAIDSFMDFGNRVFGQPRVFHEKSTLFLPRAKYSAAKAREAFKTIIENSTASDSNFSADTEIFRYREDRTRT
jgi:hypothetical protein